MGEPVIHQLTLSTADNDALEPLLDDLAERHRTIEDPELVRRSRVLARALPAHLLEFLEEYRLGEASALCLVSGLRLDEDALGPTPDHWRNRPAASPALRQEIFFLLCAAALGDVFGWATQQDGRIMHDVLPIRGDELREIGSNSLQHLSWHTEDAFHPCRGDYVALLCLKNPDGVETVVCSIADIDLSRLDVDGLFRPEFSVMPDNSHQPQDGSPLDGDADVERLRRRSFELIAAWSDDPEPRPLFYGDPRDPYLALDPYHMDDARWPERAQRAFAQLVEQIDHGMRDIVLAPGDCVFIDNFRAVHGRKAFTPRYDGSDRWLKRLNITRNIRGSRAWRVAPDARIIY